MVIKDMAARFAGNDGIEWKVLDVRHMEDIQDEEFEVAIDKSTLDPMISGSMWDLPEDVKRNIRSYIDEVSLYLAKMCIIFA